MHLRWSKRTLHHGLELGIDIRLRKIHFLDDSLLAILLLGLHRGKRLGLVGALSSPRDVVPVGEGVNVEDVGEGGHEEQVLQEGGEHVPGIEVQEGGDEVETEGRDHGDEDDADTVWTEELG